MKLHCVFVLCAFAASGFAASSPPLIPFATIKADPVGERLQSAMIWAGSETKEPGVAVAFRKNFKLADDPKHAAFHIFADARYVLWVNGNYVERGPARFQPNGPEYDSVDVSSRLRVGDNVLALLVVGNLSGGKVMRHEPGLTAMLEVDGREMFHTDASWKWSEKTRYRKVSASWANLGDTEVDARVEDGDWTLAGYADKNWKPAVLISGNGWGTLTARRIPLLREKLVTIEFAGNVKLPISLTSGQKLEFTTGRIVQAYPVIELTAEAGSELSLEPFGVKYLAKAGPQSHFTIDSRGITKGAVVVNKGSATITGFRLIERLYPYDRLGSFKSNDAFLNRLWEMCARSCEVLSEDSYVDCADRERVEWMDDDPPGFDITRTTMAGPAGPDGKPVYSDPRLLGEMIRRTALTLQPEGWVKAHTCSDRYDIHAKMEDRACGWVDGIRRYYEATGDTDQIREIWPAVVAQMDYFLKRRTERGLVRARDWVVWGNPVGYINGEGTTLNVFIQRALADSAFLGNLIGKQNDSVRFTQAADDLAKAINSVLWNEPSGGYYSGYFSDEDLSASERKLKLPRTNGLTPVTLHANVFALDRGIVPPARRERVIAGMLKQLPEKLAGANMVYYYLIKQLYALDRPGLDTRVLAMFRQGWQPMVASPWECSWESFGGGSKAHIYGMYPGYFLSSYVLGVRWQDGVPLNRRLLVEPHLGDLNQAEGTVVTEAGPVEVSWKRSASGAFEFRGKLPPGLTAELSLPAKNITLNGKTTTGSPSGQRYTFKLSGGEFTGITH